MKRFCGAVLMVLVGAAPVFGESVWELTWRTNVQPAVLLFPSRVALGFGNGGSWTLSYQTPWNLHFGLGFGYSWVGGDRSYLGSAYYMVPMGWSQPIHPDWDWDLTLTPRIGMFGLMGIGYGVSVDFESAWKWKMKEYWGLGLGLGSQWTTFFTYPGLQNHTLTFPVSLQTFLKF